MCRYRAEQRGHCSDVTSTMINSRLVMSVESFQSVNLVSASMFLLLFFVSGALTEGCPEYSALFISAPQRIEALSGSCLQVSCNFSAREKTEFDNKRKIFGLWYKDEKGIYFQENVVFNSSGSVLKYPLKITGDLKKKNCTTLFTNLNTTFTGIYYFKIEIRPFRGTAVCDPLQITVKDSPPSPRIEISGDLKEGESVTITCSALTPCPHLPPKLTWSLQKDSHNHMEKNTDGSFTTKIQESITLSDQHDGNIITCSVSYPVNEGEEKTAEETKMLRVSYAPKDTSVSISPSGLVSAGTKVNLTCSSRARPPVSSFTWFKINNNNCPMKVSEGEFFSIDVTAHGIYYCEARNNVGYQTSSRIHLGDDPVFGFVVYVTVKILGIVLLLTTVVIFECWIRSRRYNKAVKQRAEADYVNRVIEVQSS